MADGEGEGQQQQQQAAGTPPPAKGSSGESAALLAKIEDLHRDLHEERKKVKTLTGERDQFKASATTLEVKDKKRSALDKALGTLGEDFYIDEPRRKTLLESLEDLNDGPNLETRVLGLVDLAKQPKAQESNKTPFQRPGNSGDGSGDGNGASGIPEKKAGDYTPQDLAILRRTEPDRYAEIRAERDKTIGFGGR